MSASTVSDARLSTRFGVGSPAPWAALTGVLFLVLSAVSLSNDPIPVLDLVFAGAWLSAALPVLGLRALHDGRDGAPGRIGTLLLVVGAVANAVGLGVHVAGSDALYVLALPVSGALIFLGLVLLAVATWRARVLPRWTSVAMVAVLPLTFLTGIWFPLQGDGSGDYPGVFVVGAFWLALALVSHRRTG